MNNEQDTIKLCAMTRIIPMLLAIWVVITYTSFEVFGWSAVDMIFYPLLPASLQFVAMVFSILA